MILEKMEVTTVLTKIQCGQCGGVYALSERYVNRKRELSGSWNCPYCKTSWGWSLSNSELEIAKREAKRANDNLAREQARHDQTKMSMRAHKSAKTRLKNRIANGACPCCNRYFKNLHQHIKNKHPKYNEEQ